ncbi:MAG: hypothetical protein JO117_10190 [Verrucomicrobia bacterium]|nr:hypothetical protein [Verrucomicrobiota bacterium]
MRATPAQVLEKIFSFGICVFCARRASAIIAERHARDAALPLESYDDSVDFLKNKCVGCK